MKIVTHSLRDPISPDSIRAHLEGSTIRERSEFLWEISSGLPTVVDSCIVVSKLNEAREKIVHVR